MIPSEPMECRRCDECRGMSHHWMPDPHPVSYDDERVWDYVCKHCDVVGEECEACWGDGCEECGHEGVVPIGRRDVEEDDDGE